MKVPFSEQGWRKAVAGGEARQGNHRPGDRDSLRTRVNPNHEHVLGFIAERAFEHLSGLPMDTALRQGGDNLVDFKAIGCLGETVTIDVKAQSRDYYAMKIKTHQIQATDHHAYVHAWVDEANRQVVFYGWLWGDEAKRVPPVPARGAGMTTKNHEIERDDGAAKPLSELLAYISKTGRPYC